MVAIEDIRAEEAVVRDPRTVVEFAENLIAGVPALVGEEVGLGELYELEARLRQVADTVAYVTAVIQDMATALELAQRGDLEKYLVPLAPDSWIRQCEAKRISSASAAEARLRGTGRW